MSFEELGLRHATGEEINGEALLAGASGVMMLPIPCSGRLRAVSGVEEALAAPNIQEVKITIPLGNLAIAPVEYWTQKNACIIDGL